MTDLTFLLAGGIGLFLLGMVLLTEGLKSFAGDALSQALARFTGTPFKAFVSGTAVTAMVQSSSAATVTVIGFVSAGLLTFSQAIGVVFGASLGTTFTGWIVAGLGLNVSVGFYALPLVGIGAFLRLLGKGRWRPLGLAVGGFGLIFIGIGTLQEAMSGLSEVFDLARLPSDSLLGHLLAMLIGIVLTVLMQSSSAAVATTLTALHTGAINFEQAAALVIGSAIGTTITGALAAIGGNVAAKRTALAHISFNLSTGLIALILLPLFLKMIAWAQLNLGLDPGAMSLVAFHTLFIALGVAVFMPFIEPYARLIMRVLPDRDPPLTRHLDRTVLTLPPVALEASRRALVDIAAETFRALARRIRPDATPPHPAQPAEDLIEGLKRLQDFLREVPAIADDQPLSNRRLDQMHAIEHLTRLQARLTLPESVKRQLPLDNFQEVIAMTADILLEGADLLETNPEASLDSLEAKATRLVNLRKNHRPKVLRESAIGSADPSSTMDQLDAMRWFDRLGYHTWRICLHLDPNVVTPPDTDQE